MIGAVVEDQVVKVRIQEIRAAELGDKQKPQIGRLGRRDYAIRMAEEEAVEMLGLGEFKTYVM